MLSDRDGDGVWQCPVTPAEVQAAVGGAEARRGGRAGSSRPPNIPGTVRLTWSLVGGPEEHTREVNAETRISKITSHVPGGQTTHL